MSGLVVRRHRDRSAWVVRRIGLHRPTVGRHTCHSPDRNVSKIQRGRPAPAHRHVGSATFRTREPAATTGSASPEDIIDHPLKRQGRSSDLVLVDLRSARDAGGALGGNAPRSTSRGGGSACPSVVRSRTIRSTSRSTRLTSLTKCGRRDDGGRDLDCGAFTATAATIGSTKTDCHCRKRFGRPGAQMQ